MGNAFGRLSAKLKRFVAANGGNVAMTFGLATLPIIGGVGAAIDFGHAHAVKSAMQSALDATALMISRDAPGLNDSDLQTKVRSYFNAMFNRPDATGVSVSAVYTSTAGSQVIINGSADVATSVMGILGHHYIAVTGSSTVKWGTDRLRVALALDVTGSMASAGKLAALKTATKTLLTQLKNAGSVNGDVYVSIIPFNKDVNVGASNYNATWLDWTAWDAANSSSGAMVGSICYNGTLWEVDSSGWRNSGSCSGTGGGICYQGTLWKYNGNWYSAGGCTHQTWNGCVTDRGNSSGPHTDQYDRKVTEPSTSIRASLWPAEQYGSCPAQMKGLSYDWDGMNTLVDSLQADGNTNQPIGLVWAWQSLVGGGPLTAPPKDSNYIYNEVIVLMSDGLNTQNRWSRTQSNIDQRMYDGANAGIGTCDNIKKAGVTIYTVHVNTDGDPKSTLLENCATDTNKFWMVTAADQIGTVFKTIGTNISKLRVVQ
jgi:Flp pilus assembly protein TadG